MQTLKPIALILSLTLPFAGVQAAETGQTSTSTAQSATSEAPVRAHLGVAVDRVPPPLAAQLPEDVPRGQGLIVLRVQPDSPASQAGLQPYDVLLSYDDQRLFAPEQLVQLVANDRPGREVRLQIVRAGQSRELKVKLGAGASAPPSLAFRGSRPWGQGMPPMHRHEPPRPFAPKVREVFQSMAVERLPDGRYRAAMKYKDVDGKLRSFSFEGSREEIRRQILETSELPAPARRQLLNAIGMAERPPFPPFGRPLNFGELMQLWQDGGWQDW